jgi:hypothetical protein
VDVKEAQGIMRHSRASTTQDIYQQQVPETQQRAVRKLTEYVRQAEAVETTLVQNRHSSERPLLILKDIPVLSRS